jgi:hypothetical protein
MLPRIFETRLRAVRKRRPDATDEDVAAEALDELHAEGYVGEGDEDLAFHQAVEFLRADRRRA